MTRYESVSIRMSLEEMKKTLGLPPDCVLYAVITLDTNPISFEVRYTREGS